jgi:hypothetical protein
MKNLIITFICFLWLIFQSVLLDAKRNNWISISECLMYYAHQILWISSTTSFKRKAAYTECKAKGTRDAYDYFFKKI